MSRTAGAPLGSRLILKVSSVVLVGVFRHGVGRDNGSRWNTEVGNYRIFICTCFSEVRMQHPA
jgi:hypothetical protein